MVYCKWPIFYLIQNLIIHTYIVIQHWMMIDDAMKIICEKAIHINMIMTPVNSQFVLITLHWR